MTGKLQLEVILLAAGQSRRMGTKNKLLITVDGEPLVRRSAQLYRRFTDKVFVVLGYEADQVRAALDGVAVRCIENAAYADGQKSSVQCGFTNVSGAGDAIIVALADQPLLSSEDLDGLITAFAESDRQRIMIPFCGDARGNPILIPSAFLKSLKDDVQDLACRKFIAANPHLTRRYDAPNDHFTTDLDTPDDARRMGIVVEDSLQLQTT